MKRIRLALPLLALCLIAAVTATSASGKGKGPTGYVQTNLVSDQTGQGASQPPDTNLVNAWGLAALTGSPWWVADNGTSVATIYKADGTKVGLTVSVPTNPTGAVANNGSDFGLSDNSPALFLFSTEDGHILAWNLGFGSAAGVVVDRTKAHAVYKGLAIASTSSGDRLYATDFHNGRVDVFGGNFKPVHTHGRFVDHQIPHGYAPFGIQNVNGTIFVTYAKQDKARHDDDAGKGHGFVDMFDTSGKLLGRVASRGALNSPWGIAWAPSGFGSASGDLLIGNFGDGTINAFKPDPHGEFHPDGQLQASGGGMLTIDGLWSLQFGHGATANNGPTTTLFFTAGPDHEGHGLFGTITSG
jgi:uncharacterized protein (TIGR03118 family)